MDLKLKIRQLRSNAGPLPIWAGFAEVLVAIGLLTVTLALLTRSSGLPTPETLRTIATVGAALFLAYVVEAVWLVETARRENHHEQWLGAVCGFGFGGLLGVAVGLATAANVEAGSSIHFVDRLGLWWSTASIALLGILVALHPLVVDREIRRKREEAG